MPTHEAQLALTAAAGISAAATITFDHAAQALRYRLQQQAREDSRLIREQALVGSAAAVVASQAGWEPLRHWDGWDPERKVLGEPV